MRSFTFSSIIVLSLAIGAFSSPTLDFLDPFLSIGSSGSGAVSGNVGGLGGGAAAAGSLSGGAGADLGAGGVGIAPGRDFGGVGGGAGAGLSGAASGHVGAGLGNLVGFDASGSIAGQKSIGLDGGFVPQPIHEVEDERILRPIPQPVRIQPQPIRPLPPPAPAAKPCAHPLPRPLGHGHPQPVRQSGHYRRAIEQDNHHKQLDAHKAEVNSSKNGTNGHGHVEIVELDPLLVRRDANSQIHQTHELNAHPKNDANATKNGTLVEIVQFEPLLFKRDAAHPQGQGQGHEGHQLHAESQLPHDAKLVKNETAANSTRSKDAAASSADRNVSPKLSGVAHMFHNMFGGGR